MLSGFEKMNEDEAAPWQGTEAPMGEMFPALFAAADARNARALAAEARSRAELTILLGKKDAGICGGALAAVLVGAFAPKLVALGVAALIFVAFLVVVVRGAKQYLALGEIIASAREQAMQFEQNALSLQHEADRKIKVLPPEEDKKDPPATTVALPAE